MRKVLALLALLAVVAVWNGCSQSSTSPTNAPTSSKVGPESAGGSNANMSPNTTTNTKAPSPTGIKPPMKDEKK